MIEEVKLPEISENVESGEVISVLVSVGDIIKKDDPLIELETDKAAFEVPSTSSGMIIELLVQAGDTINLGDTIVKIDTEAKPGDKPTAAPVASVPTARTKPLPKPEPEPVEISPAPALKSKHEPKSPEQPAAQTTGDTEAVAAPAVRQLARELGIDINKVPPSGPEGHVTTDDVKAFAKSLINSTPNPSAATTARPGADNWPLPDFSHFGDIERKSISSTRKAIAAQLGYSWPLVPQVTHHDQADITELEEFRNEYGEKVKAAGGKLTVTSILLKVVANALAEFENFNVSFDPAAKELIYKKYCHIAVAVDTDRGLLVPVVRDCDKKDILQLAVELTKISEKTRNHEVSMNDLQGGCFTISNLGGIGGTGFTPIVYWPQVAILGVSRSVKTTAFKDGLCTPRIILPLSLSYDHRVIDGAQAARFVRYVAETLEKPFMLALREPG